MTKSNFLSLQRQIIIALFTVTFTYNRSNQEYLKLQTLESDFFVNQVGYFNLSCPFEMAKLSCAYTEYEPGDRVRTNSSRNFYIENINVIHHAFWKAFGGSNHRRIRHIFMTGDSLTRQLFIALACNAVTLYDGIANNVEVHWKDTFPCANDRLCKIPGGEHSGFDAASVIFKGGTELHFVPHHGGRDRLTSEANVLERLAEEVQSTGRVTFGEKTALPTDGPVDVLVYNVGIHYDGQHFRDTVNFFANKVAFPLMNNHTNVRTRPRIIYVTTPTQHFNTPNGVFITGKMGRKFLRKCVDEVETNPRADVEKEILAPGVNVDVLLDSDDLNKGIMHVGKSDCSHYCMPGALDIVAARILDAITAI